MKYHIIFKYLKSGFHINEKWGSHLPNLRRYKNKVLFLADKHMHHEYNSRYIKQWQFVVYIETVIEVVSIYQ